jgi:CheY-like chemotaxis protein
MAETGLDSTPRVLVADDVPVNLKVMTAALGADFDLVLANGGAEALQLARSDPQPDLIVLDILMPDIDGFEVCRQLKTDASTAHIPVIFVTALDDRINEEYGLKIGAVDYIYKPINAPVVRARVKLHLDMQMQREFLERLLDLRSEELQTAQAEARQLLMARTIPLIPADS